MTIIIILIYGIHQDWCYADRLVTISTVKTRPLALGGAFISLKDDLAALDYNPAGFQQGRVLQESNFTIYFNVFGPIITLKNEHNYSDWTVPFGWFIRGASFSIGRLHLGVLFNEEALFDTVRLERTSIFDATGYDEQRNASFGLSITLASKVSIGIAGEAFIRGGEKEIFKLGHRYGLILKPKNNFSVGLCFVNFPNQYSDDRLKLEGLADETLNIGVSYSPWPLVTLAIDVRNVSDEGKGADGEPRFGIEINPFQYLAVRGGYFRPPHMDEETFSFGVGISGKETETMNDFRLLPIKFNIDATVLWQKEVLKTQRWFLLSCIIGI